MARARFSDATYRILRATLSNYSIARAMDKGFFSRVIKKDGFVRNIKQKDYPIVRPSGPSRAVRFSEDLPFRVRFTNIVVPGHSASNVPPIGIQIIEFSNYIL